MAWAADQNSGTFIAAGLAGQDLVEHVAVARQRNARVGLAVLPSENMARPCHTSC